MARWLSTRSLLAMGTVGPVLFVGIALTAGATRPGYDPVRQYVSLLSLGQGGWVQIANFIVTGALIAGFGLGVRRSWPGGPGARWVPRLIILVGAALVVSGIFVTDPAQGYPAGAPAGLPTDASWHAGIHYLGALIVFVGLPAAIVIAARRGPAAQQRLWTLYSLLSAFGMVGFWLGTFAFPGANDAPAIAGLLQRIAVIAGFQWLATTSLIELRRGLPAPALAYA